MQKFNFHTHTARCNHAEPVPDSEYVEAHIRAGFDRMAFTDHCPLEKKPIPADIPRSHMFLEERPEYERSIRELKNLYRDRIRIYLGYEVEFSPVWVDELEELRRNTDLLVLGQHLTIGENGEIFPLHSPRHGHNRSDYLCYANLVKEGLKTGLFDILAHPDLFSILGLPFNADQEGCSDIILRAAEETGIPIEINLIKVALSLRFGEKKPIPYPNPDFWRMAAAYDVDVVYGWDVHGLFQLENNEVILENAEKIIGYDTVSRLHFVDKLKFERRIDNE